MAFNFNWSPLTADASFYTRAQELLTTALNKSPKPPIIVDDILVNELNLGSVPPDLEILEIGDLAEDRFRGIFKMCYSGDAFLTLKTRVQANPLNTYLSTRSAFASPEPLSAASGLTIPLKITLSEIRLSAFIILVFSKQKGLTLVFRNDPLESLKVSSTFDSIPFVRNYLQKEIEAQLRTLLMDEVPAIIHRLSLRLWVPEFRAREDEELAREGGDDSKEDVIDPLASPPQDPVDAFGHALDAAQIEAISLDSGVEHHSLFSQKNLLRLAALTDSQRTLSLFTPAMRDVVFRAWAGPMERGEAGIFSPAHPHQPNFSRKQSLASGAGTTYTFSDSSDTNSNIVRTTLPHSTSYTGLPSAKFGRPGRKRKHRVVNLRKTRSNLEDVQSMSGGGESSRSETMSTTTSEAEALAMQETIRPRERELVTPPSSPKMHQFAQNSTDSIDGNSPQKMQERTPRPPKAAEASLRFQEPTIGYFESHHHGSHEASMRPRPTRYFQSFQLPSERPQPSSSSAAAPPPFLAAPFPYVESSPGGILEQAWMMKMAGEIARRVHDQKTSDGAAFWDSGERDDSPPPAYAT